MSTFTAYLDDQDLIRIQKGETAFPRMRKGNLSFSANSTRGSFGLE